MSDHFDAPGFSNPDGDPRIDIADHYAFLKPGDPCKTVFVLDVNPVAAADNFRNDAEYATLVDTDGDNLPNIIFVYKFTAKDASGNQYCTASRRAPESGDDVVLVRHAPVSFGATATVSDGADGTRLFAGLRADPFFFDTLAWLNNFSFTNPGSNFFANKNVYSIVFEVPNSLLGSNPQLGVWTRTRIPSTYNQNQLVLVDQAGRPAVNSFYNSGNDLNTFNQTEPSQQRNTVTQSGLTFVASFAATLQKWGYSPKQANSIALWLLPDILPYDFSKPTGYPNGRALRDDVVSYMLNQLTNGQKPSDYVATPTNYLSDFPYVGTPH